MSSTSTTATASKKAPAHATAAMPPKCYTHTLKLVDDVGNGVGGTTRRVLYTLEWSGKQRCVQTKHDRAHLPCWLPGRGGHRYRVTYSNNFSDTSLDLDLWDDFETEQTYSPFGYRPAEMLHKQYFFMLNGHMMKLRLALWNYLDSLNHFELSVMAMKKAELCLGCKTHKWKHLSYAKKTCSECELTHFEQRLGEWAAENGVSFDDSEQ